MRSPGALIPIALLWALPTAVADETLYRYEGDVLPYDESAGWLIADACEDECTESLEKGHFVLHWTEARDLVNNHYWIAQPPEEPPPLPLGGMAVSLQPPEGAELLHLRCDLRRSVR